MAEDFNSPVERVAGAVVFRVLDGQPQYLLAKTRDGYRFPQRRIWPGEKPEATVARAVQETAGTGNLEFVQPSRFRCMSSYPGWDPLLREPVPHHATYLLVRVTPLDPDASCAGSNACWVDLAQARQMLAGTPFLDVLNQASELVRETLENGGPQGKEK